MKLSKREQRSTKMCLFWIHLINLANTAMVRSIPQTSIFVSEPKSSSEREELDICVAAEVVMTIDVCYYHSLYRKSHPSTILRVLMLSCRHALSSLTLAASSYHGALKLFLVSVNMARLREATNKGSQLCALSWVTRLQNKYEGEFCSWHNATLSLCKIISPDFFSF